MKGPSSWVLALPLISLALAAILFVRSDRESEVLFERGKEQWRSGNYQEAIEQFVTLLEKAPNSRYAPEALWELATVYYFNLYDISNSLHYFNRLTAEYPDSEHSVESHLRIAEIYEVELNEPSKAQEHWTQVLASAEDPAQVWEIQFRIADSHFKTSEFDRAFEGFSRIVDLAPEPHLVEQSRIRLGAIYQLRNQQEVAISEFYAVLEGTSCENCRLRAQLGLIECLERLDRLPEAIEIAENISVGEYPEPMRAELLQRLIEKKKYYEPSLWTGH